MALVAKVADLPWAAVVLAMRGASLGGGGHCEEDGGGEKPVHDLRSSGRLAVS